ncbi:MAG: hypothetical protein AAF581_08665 [Planctomycetota bacterium]
MKARVSSATLTLSLLVGWLVLPGWAQSDDGPSTSFEGLPPIEFADPEHAMHYTKGLQLLEQGEYKKAASEFRRLKNKVAEGLEREGVQRAYLEAQGGVELVKALGYEKKGRTRRALAHLEKVESKYAATEIGEQISFYRETFWAQIFHRIESFEKKTKKKANENDERGKSADEDEGDDDSSGLGGDSAYGPNTKTVDKADDSKKVREGEAALEWATGKELVALSFDRLPDDLEEYRYLRFSVRSARGERPQLLILFDCLDNFGSRFEQRGGGGFGGGRGGGGGGRGGGGGGGNGAGGNNPGRGNGSAWVYQRDGYSMFAVPQRKWQDFRLDLKKFAEKGAASWSAVKALRIVHMPGVSSRLYLDDIRLERE